ncbi:hypothetical protein Avbf_11069 [Armadillidium vulgare]|nr:hypothetical protein Avbf_11069 [Armadillidium vulgare]
MYSECDITNIGENIDEAASTFIKKSLNFERSEKGNLIRMPDLRRKALRNASRLQLKEKIRNFIKSSSYYMSEEDEQIIKWNKDQLKTGTRKQSLKRENDANLPYAILSAPAHYEGKIS